MKNGKKLIGLLTAAILVVTLCAPLALAEGEAEPLWSNASGWFEEEADADLMELFLYPEVLNDADLTKDITREEFAALAVALYEALNEKDIEPAPDTTFEDTKNADVLKAFAANIVDGTSAGKFSPNAPLTREAAATMMARVYKSINWDGWTLKGDGDYNTHTLDTAGVSKFPDDANVSSWSREAVYFMAKYELIKGTATGNANPKGNMSREQAVIISQRLYNGWDDIKDGPAVTDPEAPEAE